MLRRFSVSLLFCTLVLFANSQTNQPQTKEEKEKAFALVEFSMEEVNFDTVPQADNVMRKMKVTNNSPATLFITNVVASCNCLKATFDRMPIQPGESSEVTFILETRKAQGRLTYAYTVVTNFGSKVLKSFGYIETPPKPSASKAKPKTNE